MALDKFLVWIDKARSELADKADERIGHSGKATMPIASDSGERFAVIGLHLPTRQYEIKEEFFRLLDKALPRESVKRLRREYPLTESSKVRELIWMMDDFREELCQTTKHPVGGGGNQSRANRGRPTKTDPAADRRIAEAWSTGRYAKHADLAAELGYSTRDVKLALDRHRKRQKRTE